MVVKKKKRGEPFHHPSSRVKKFGRKGEREREREREKRESHAREFFLCVWTLRRRKRDKMTSCFAVDNLFIYFHARLDLCEVQSRGARTHTLSSKSNSLGNPRAL